MDSLIWLSAGAALGFIMGWGLFAARNSRLAAEQRLMESDLERTRSERTELYERAIRAEANLNALQQRQQELQDKMRLEFHNTAHALFEVMSNKFTAESEQRIGDMLNPLRERLGEFQKSFSESLTQHGKEQHTLKSEIEKIVRVNDSLAKALRGDVKAQGNWGEVMLERILEESGLRRGLDYIVQGAHTSTEGNRVQPDVVVKLPEGKHVIIDAKVSLTAYDRYCGETDAVLRESYLRDFLRSVRSHVNGLEQKRYQDIEALGAPDFVLMFMPIEGAFSFALEQDQDLHRYAWSKKIVMVCPSTLFATLKTVASLWRIESQNKNAEEIARQAGALYDKFVGFVDDLQTIGAQIDRLHGSYGQAMNKLTTGTGNLVGRAEKIKALGARASKSLPADMLRDEPNDKVVSLVQTEEF